MILEFSDKEIQRIKNKDFTGQELEAKISHSENELRLKTLRGEWIPEKGEWFIPIGKGGGELVRDQAEMSLTNFCKEQSDWLCFAPTLPLAEELSKAIQGKWKPINGDKVWFCHDGSLAEIGEIRAKGFNGMVWDDRRDAADSILCFPSELQRATYIKSLPQPEEKEIVVAFKKKCLSDLKHAVEQVGKNQYFNALSSIGDATREAAFALQSLLNDSKNAEL